MAIAAGTIAVYIVSQAINNGREYPVSSILYPVSCTGFSLHKFLQLLHHRIYFCPGIMLAETETYGYLVGIIVDGTDNMAALVGAAGAGAAATGTDIIDIEIEEDHLRLFCLWKTHAEYGI